MPDLERTPPTSIQNVCAKMPPSAYALILVIDGKMENPEFVVWRIDDYNEELWKWKRKMDGYMHKKHIEYWAKKGKTFYKINPWSY